MSAITDFQTKLLTDEATRRAFAQDPAKVLADLGIKLPPGVQPPANIPIADLDAKVAEVNEGLKDQGISLNQIDMDDPGSVTRFVENAVPLRTKDLQYMRAVHEGLENAAVAARPPHGETVAVLGAVVAVVVATPVVAVVRMQTLEDIAQSEIGVTGVTRDRRVRPVWPGWRSCRRAWGQRRGQHHHKAALANRGRRGGRVRHGTPHGLVVAGPPLGPRTSAFASIVR